MRLVAVTVYNPEAKEKNGTGTICGPREQSKQSIMKLALNVFALAVGVALWTTPVKSLDRSDEKFVLGVTANDNVWKKHLNVGIKLDTKTLSAAARKVLLGLKVLKAWTADQGEQEEPSHVVVPALHIVADVASHYSNQGLALELAKDSMAAAIKCRMLGYVLVQLEAIAKTNELQNEAITSQPSEIWNTLIHVLDKTSVLKDSFQEEFDMYQQWKGIATQNMTKDLPPDFEAFKTRVMESLSETCEVSSLSQIQEYMRVDDTENLNSAAGAINIFIKCQKMLKEMFTEIPISTAKVEDWEIVLNKPKFIEPSETPLPLTI